MKSAAVHVVAVMAVVLAVAPDLIAGGGGPDAGGYLWFDDQDGCPTGSRGELLENAESFRVNQWVVGPIELGFDFPFYDRTFDRVWVHEDGMIFFTDTFDSYTLGSSPIPTVDSIDGGALFPYWADLQTLSPAFYWQRFPDDEVFRITFNGFQFAGQARPLWQEVSLHRNGDVRVEYVLPGDGGSLAAIGIESPDQTTGLEVLYHGSSPGGLDLTGPGPHSVCFTRPSGLDCSAVEALACGFTFGSLPAGEPSRADTYGCGGSWTGPEAIYEIELEQVSDVSVSLTPSGTSMGVFLLAGCTEWACLDGGGLAASAERLNAGTHRIVVDAATPADVGNFSLSVRCTPVGEAIACGGAVEGTTLGGVAELDGYRCLAGDFAGPESHHVVEHDGTGPLRVEVTSTDGKGAFLFPAEGPLGPTECLAGGVGGTTLWHAPAGRYLIVVDGPAGSDGDYGLRLGCDAALSCDPGGGLLGCNETVASTTEGLPSVVERYGCGDDPLAGPEAVFRFTNPVDQVVYFQLDDSADPRLDLLVLDSCNESACLARGDSLIEVALLAGEYVVVVDGPAGVEAPFAISATCHLGLEPASVSVQLDPGECFTEHKTAWVPPVPRRADVLFAIDASSSTGEERTRLNFRIREIMDTVDGLVPDVAYGVMSFVDYPGGNAGTSPCEYDIGSYGAGSDYAYRLDRPLTLDRAAVEAALRNVQGGDGADVAEAYVRALFETYADAAIGWRPEAQRVVVMFGDELPHGCNLLECFGDVTDETRAISPGRDGIGGTADDLELLDVLLGMADAGIQLVYADSGTDSIASTSGRVYSSPEIWGCLAEITGGRMVRLNSDGTVPDGTRFGAFMATVIRDAASACSSLELVAEAGYESWLVSATPVHLSFRPPGVAEFEIEVCAPPDVPSPSSHDFEVLLKCGDEVLSSQRVHAEVGRDDCGGLVSDPPEDLSTCIGDEVVLDGSGVSVGPCDGEIEHRWTDSSGSVVSTGPLATVAPLDDETYELTVTCLANPACSVSLGVDVTVERPPGPFTAAATDPSDCSLGILLSWTEAAFARPGGHHNVYRSEASCEDALSRPPVISGLTSLGWLDANAPPDVALHYVVEAENSFGEAACSPSGPRGGAASRACVAPIVDRGVEPFPEGVFATLRLRHDGHVVTSTWEAARPLQGAEHFHLLKARDQPTAVFTTINGEADLAREFSDLDAGSALQFFDLRVANACEDISADEFPAGWDR